MEVKDEVTAQIISRAVGAELRRSREAIGWSRGQVVARLPSGIGDRTVLSYEHGTRQLTVPRLVELCHAYSVPAPGLLNQALQVARIHLQNLVLWVDLRVLLADRTDMFRPLFQWARNKLNQNPDGIIEIAPASVAELATFLGCSRSDLANYLARFAPHISSTDGGMRPQTTAH